MSASASETRGLRGFERHELQALRVGGDVALRHGQRTHARLERDPADGREDVERARRVHRVRRQRDRGAVGHRVERLVALRVQAHRRRRHMHHRHEVEALLLVGGVEVQRVLEDVGVDLPALDCVVGLHALAELDVLDGVAELLQLGLDAVREGIAVRAGHEAHAQVGGVGGNLKKQAQGQGRRAVGRTSAPARARAKKSA